MIARPRLVRSLLGILPQRGATRLAASAVAVLYAVLLFTQLRVGLDYDEAYNLQLAQNFAAGHGFATFGAVLGHDYSPFDALVSTGPTVMIPATVVWLLTGGSILAERALMLGFFLLVPIGAWLFGRRFGDRAGLLMCCAPFLLCVQQPDNYNNSLVPGRVLGEYAGLGLCLLALWLLSEGQALFGGLCLGLMVQSKSALLILGACILVAWALELWWSKRRFPLIQIRAAAIGAVAPTLLYYVGMFVTLGPTRFGRQWRESSEFLAGQSRFQGWVPQSPKVDLLWRLTSPLGQAVLLVILFALVASALMGNVAAAGRHRPARRDVVLALSAAAGAVVSIVVWLCWSTAKNARQAVPGVILVGGVVLAAAVRYFAGQASRRRSLLSDVAVFAVIAILATSLGIGVSSDGNLRMWREQQAAAKAIRWSGTPSLPTYGWWTNPEQTLLTKLPPETLTGVPPATVDVFTSVQVGVEVAKSNEIGDARVLAAKECRGEILYSSQTVVVCRR